MHQMLLILDNGVKIKEMVFQFIVHFAVGLFNEMVNFQNSCVFHLNADVAGLRVSVSALKSLLHWEIQWQYNFHCFLGNLFLYKNSSLSSGCCLEWDLKFIILRTQWNHLIWKFVFFFKSETFPSFQISTPHHHSVVCVIPVNQMLEWCPAGSILHVSSLSF